MTILFILCGMLSHKFISQVSVPSSLGDGWLQIKLRIAAACRMLLRLTLVFVHFFSRALLALDEENAECKALTIDYFGNATKASSPDESCPASTVGRFQPFQVINCSRRQVIAYFCLAVVLLKFYFVLVQKLFMN